MKKIATLALILSCFMVNAQDRTANRNWSEATNFEASWAAHRLDGKQNERSPFMALFTCDTALRTIHFQSSDGQDSVFHYTAFKRYPADPTLNPDGLYYVLSNRATLVWYPLVYTVVINYAKHRVIYNN